MFLTKTKEIFSQIIKILKFIAQPLINLIAVILLFYKNYSKLAIKKYFNENQGWIENFFISNENKFFEFLKTSQSIWLEQFIEFKIKKIRFT